MASSVLDGEFEQIQAQNTSPMNGLLSPFPQLLVWLPTRGHCKTHFNLQFEVSLDYPFFHMQQPVSPQENDFSGWTRAAANPQMIPKTTTYFPMIAALHKQSPTE